MSRAISECRGCGYTTDCTNFKGCPDMSKDAVLTERKPTNFERVTASPEALVHFMVFDPKSRRCKMCKHEGCTRKNCAEVLTEWLESEVDDE